MHDITKWLISAVCGSVAAFFGQYGLFFGLVAVAVVLDVVTGLIKVKATGEGLSSKKANRGFWRKISLFAALFFGIFLDYVSVVVLAQAGVSLPVETPFALIICAYIIINEAISVAENLYLANPDSFPKWISDKLKIARDQVARENGEAEDMTEDESEEGHENGGDESDQGKI